MAVFLVTYDLNREAVRPKVLDTLREAWNWARLSESSYAVEATGADVVYDTLKPLLDENDDLFVIPLKKPYRGWGSQEVHNWLASKLTY